MKGKGCESIDIFYGILIKICKWKKCISNLGKLNKIKMNNLFYLI